MLLTIDIGTSTFKSALWDIDGNRLSFAAVPLSFDFDGVKHETSPSRWLGAFEDCCKKLLADKKIENLAAVQVLIISGNGPSLVPVLGEPIVGKQGLSLGAENSRLWLDRRSVEHLAEVMKVTNCNDARFFVPKIYSIKKDELELYKKTKYFLGCPEYLACALTGQARTVFPCDGFDRWFWDSGALKKLDLDAQKFPTFIRPGDQFGSLLAQVSEYFGFAKNVPVISGGPDFFSAIIGSGVTETGQACDRTGTSDGINFCTQNRIDDNRLMSYGHPIKPYWNSSGVISTTGKAVDWARALLGFEDIEDFLSLARESKSGSGGLVFRPFLAGEHSPDFTPPDRAHLFGMSLSTGRSEFANSVLEGIGFAIRDIIDIMESSGEKIKDLRVTGGLAGCSLLNQIKADITGKEVLEGVHKEAELLGAFIIGACFLGKFGSYAEGSSAMCRVEKHYEPNMGNAALYNNLFNVYKHKE
ncbi:MAG: hypothetical protein LBI28_11285 [Treponema sp.]|jgi:xylulokinase|nr:hypothetical protein [Treponema sp.]